jgi:hypothetical protein
MKNQDTSTDAATITFRADADMRKKLDEIAAELSEQIQAMHLNISVTTTAAIGTCINREHMRLLERRGPSSCPAPDRSFTAPPMIEPKRRGGSR